MTVYRANEYAVIPRESAQNTRLRLEEKGLLIAIASLGYETITPDDLLDICWEDKETIEKWLDELTASGYLEAEE